MTQVSDLATVLREMGPGWFAWRSFYEFKLRAGILRRQFVPCDPSVVLARALAPQDLDHVLFERWSESSTHFFLDQDVNRYATAVSHFGKVLQAADDATRGRFPFFSHSSADLGQPPDWLLNPVNGVHYPAGVHWTRIPDLAPELGDIKYVWEASRQAQVYYFVRAFAVTGDDRYPKAFWSQFEQWVSANPPEMGPNWRCGQEIALRSLAWVFGLYAFRRSSATTPKRVSLLLRYLWFQARHIERIHWYAARCVRNNHAISEAAGLFTIGTLFPFLPGAERWRAKGYQFLIKEGTWQIYEDGTYVQHSMNYARLVVQLFTWCLQVGQVNGVEFPELLIERLGKLLDFLWAVQDVQTGRVPNYGSNDGALIFPLSSCDYLDYRPALNALSMTLNRRRLYPPGTWDEEAVWFCGPEAIETPEVTSRDSRGKGLKKLNDSSIVRASQGFPSGGYYVLRGAGAFGMVRCGRYRHRPSQADMLHLDVWYDGINVLVDPGTFSYNLPPAWSGYFVGTSSHNTVTVDGRDQMRKGDRFIWTNWVDGKPRRFEADGTHALFVGEHSGYLPVIHRRLVALNNDVWIVVDDLFGDSAPHVYTLHWLVGDLEMVQDRTGGELRVISPSGFEQRLSLRIACTKPGEGDWVRGDDRAPRGWQSLYYGEKTPAWSYQLRVKSAGPVRFATVLAPADRVGSRGLRVEDVVAMLNSWGLSLTDFEVA